MRVAPKALIGPCLVPNVGMFVRVGPTVEFGLFSWLEGLRDGIKKAAPYV
ncbi:hypothetical protein LMG28140_05510 [Paraburkholderia metrosideri]|uniref:Uncharacterized protein n=1 Tax=Paraburkholderia metrosideri TaxID=580937 RepID=A0ABN7I6E0_9BURK|nr:hypothetical protein LMG28140_05510 [Paraburkholderia metrosideri]